MEETEAVLVIERTDVLDRIAGWLGRDNIWGQRDDRRGTTRPIGDSSPNHQELRCPGQDSNFHGVTHDT